MMLKIIIISSMVLLSYLIGCDLAENPREARARIMIHDAYVVQATEAAGYNYSRYFPGYDINLDEDRIPLYELDTYYRHQD